MQASPLCMVLPISIETHPKMGSSAAPDAPQVQDALQALLQLLLRKEGNAWRRPWYIHYHLPINGRLSSPRGKQWCYGSSEHADCWAEYKMRYRNAERVCSTCQMTWVLRAVLACQLSAPYALTQGAPAPRAVHSSVMPARPCERTWDCFQCDPVLGPAGNRDQGHKRC